MVAGCGGLHPLAPRDAASLQADLAAVRATAAAGEPAPAHAAVDRMRADVERLLSTGQLSSADGRSMLTGLSQADRRISAEVHAPAPPATPAPAPPAPGPRPLHGHGHDHKGGDGGN
jgi:hypothetical protein